MKGRFIQMQLWTKDQVLLEALEILKEDLGVTLDATGIEVIWHPISSQEVRLRQDGQSLIIETRDLPHCLQAIFTWLKKPEENLTWSYHFEQNGLMLDNARNAVTSVSMVKYLLRKMAMMGHTWYMLYMEDNYELDNYPYFGAYRGRYSKEHLKELDQYANRLGIELVPCIQTLAHLNQFFAWEHENSRFSDIEFVLNVGREATKTLIREMLTTLRECFTTKQIHLGMDEAYNLGRGHFLDEFGYQDKTTIMLNHLEFMLGLCQEIGWEPMIWDDMFFSWYNQIEEEDKIQIPKGIKLMYWDYYNVNESHYRDRIRFRGQIAEELYFAGGAWRWTGFSPHHKKTLYTSQAALTACKKEGVKKVMATAWGDDGSEAPFEVVLFGLVLYAHLDQGDYDETVFNQLLVDYTGMSLAEWLWQGEFDLLDSFDEMKALDVTPSKYLLYQDLLLPRFMKEIQLLQVDYGKAMLDLANRFERLESGSKLVNRLYVELAKTLAIKWNLPLRIWEAYHAGDKAQLRQIVKQDLVELEERLMALCQARRDVWLEEANPMGLEILEHRFGSMMMRTKTTGLRLLEYIEGKVHILEELEEERLEGAPSVKREEQQAINYNGALNTMSRSRATWG